MSASAFADLPAEILERIFEFDRPDLTRLTELASVCRKFRSVAYRIPVTIQIPVSDEKAGFLASSRIPVSTLSCQEPAMFVKYQILSLDLSRLRHVELTHQDYEKSRKELSRHYVQVLLKLRETSSRNLRRLFCNADLVSGIDEILTGFSDLRMLSVGFTKQIEFEQKLNNRSNKGRRFLKNVLSKLKRLKTFYVFSCPVSEMEIESESLERFHVYNSEFASLKRLKTPNLRKIFFHDSIKDFIEKINSNRSSVTEGHTNFYTFFEALYDGAPKLESFNGVNLKSCRREKLDKNEWMAEMSVLCLGKWLEQTGYQLEELNYEKYSQIFKFITSHQ